LDRRQLWKSLGEEEKILARSAQKQSKKDNKKVRKPAAAAKD